MVSSIAGCRAGIVCLIKRVLIITVLPEHRNQSAESPDSHICYGVHAVAVRWTFLVRVDGVFLET